MRVAHIAAPVTVAVCLVGVRAVDAVVTGGRAIGLLWGAVAVEIRVAGVMLASAAALLLAVLLRLRRDTTLARRSWQVLALGFPALAVDERFALHERVRDGVRAPRGIRATFLPWVAPADLLLMAIALAGLAVLRLVVPGLRGDRTAQVLFTVGVGLAGIAVGTDSIDPATWSLQVERVQQSLEEVVELAAGLCLLGAVLFRLLTALCRHAATEQPAAEARQDVG